MNLNFEENLLGSLRNSITRSYQTIMNGQDQDEIVLTEWPVNNRWADIAAIATNKTGAYLIFAIGEGAQRVLRYVGESGISIAGRLNLHFINPNNVNPGHVYPNAQWLLQNHGRIALNFIFLDEEPLLSYFVEQFISRRILTIEQWNLLW